MAEFRRDGHAVRLPGADDRAEPDCGFAAVHQPDRYLVAAERIGQFGTTGCSGAVRRAEPRFKRLDVIDVVAAVERPAAALQAQALQLAVDLVDLRVLQRVYLRAQAAGALDALCQGEPGRAAGYGPSVFSDSVQKPVRIPPFGAFEDDDIARCRNILHPVCEDPAEIGGGLASIARLDKPALDGVV